MALTAAELLMPNVESNAATIGHWPKWLCGFSSASEARRGVAKRVALRWWATFTNKVRYKLIGCSAYDVMDYTLARQRSCGLSHGVACTLVSATLMIVDFASPAHRSHRNSTAIDMAQ